MLVTYEALIIMNDYTVPMHVEPLHEGVNRSPSGLKCCTGLTLGNCTDNEFASKQRKMYSYADASDNATS